jgi:hypothetical protein
MDNNEHIQTALRYLPPRNPFGVDVGDVARALHYLPGTIKQNNMMTFETGGGETVYLNFPRNTRYRRRNAPQHPAVTANEPAPADDPEYSLLLADAQAFNAYRLMNRRSRWLRIALFVLLVVVIVKVIKN